jgi:phosphatidate cytidylyltransferase
MPNGQPSGTAGRNELLLRFVSALVLAPIAIATAYVGGWPFVAFWTIAAIGVVWEWMTLAGPVSRGVLAAAVSALMLTMVLFGLGHAAAAIGAIVGGAIGACVIAPDRRKGWTLAGTGCAGAVLSAPAVLRSDAEWGSCAVMLLFAAVWTTDIAAYCIGRMVGGPKLLPTISPNKTWSGAVGGVLSAVVAGAVFAVTAGLGTALAIAVLCGVLSVAAQVGDLAESAVKRTVGAKDASHLIPGHGGVMDRLDGFATAAVAATLIGLWRGGPDAPARGVVLW